MLREFDEPVDRDAPPERRWLRPMAYVLGSIVLLLVFWPLMSMIW